MDVPETYTLIISLYGPGTRMVHEGVSYEEGITLMNLYKAMPHVAQVRLLGAYEIKHVSSALTALMEEVA